MLRVQRFVNPSTSVLAVTKTRTTAFASNCLLLNFPRFFSQDDRTASPKPQSSNVRGRRRHPLDRAHRQQSPSSRNIAMPSTSSSSSSSNSASVYGNGEGEEGMHQQTRQQYQFSHSTTSLSADKQQSTLRQQELNDRSSTLLWPGTVLSDVSENPEIVNHFSNLQTNEKYRNSKKTFVLKGRHYIREVSEQFNIFPKHLLIATNAKNSTENDNNDNNNNNNRNNNNNNKMMNKKKKKNTSRSGGGGDDENENDDELPEWINSARTEIIRVQPHILEAMCPGSDGYVGDFSMPDPPLKEELMANAKKFKSILVLDNVHDTGTLGTMLRSATAFSYDAVFLVNQCADLYNHEVLSSARGVHFQQQTPIYVLKTENGDDVSAMLNHIAERNDLKPVLLSPSSSSSSSSSSSPSSGSLTGGEIQFLSPIARAALAEKKREQEQEVLDDSKDNNNNNKALTSDRIEMKSLHQLCLESYYRNSSKSEKDENVDKKKEEQLDEEEEEESGRSSSASASAAGHILCVNQRENDNGDFLRRMKRAFAPSKKKITTLLLDDDDNEGGGEEEERRAIESSSLLDSFPVVLYQLRATASTEYLPPHLKSSLSGAKTQQERLRILSEPSRPDFPHYEAPFGTVARNLSEEEYAHKIRERKAEFKMRRINKHRVSDEDAWRSFENDRTMLEHEQEQMMMNRKRGGGGGVTTTALGDDEDDEAEWKKLKKKKQRHEKKRSESVYPSPIAEQDQSIDREVLKELAQWAERYEAPPNYDHKMKPPPPSSPSSSS